MIRKDILQLRMQRSDHLTSIGLLSEEVSDWAKSWNNLRARAKRIGRDCDLSFEAYTTIASKSGLSSAKQIGTNTGNYQLGRHMDRGGYTDGNCRFITKEQNLAERWQYAKR